MLPFHYRSYQRGIKGEKIVGNEHPVLFLLESIRDLAQCSVWIRESKLKGYRFIKHPMVQMKVEQMVGLNQ